MGLTSFDNEGVRFDGDPRELSARRGTERYQKVSVKCKRRHIRGTPGGVISEVDHLVTERLGTGLRARFSCVK